LTHWSAPEAVRWIFGFFPAVFFLSLKGQSVFHLARFAEHNSILILH